MVYIATKAGGRGSDEAKANIERSFERLGVDVIDCLQVHDLGTEEELAQVLGPNGAMRAIEELGTAGLGDCPIRPRPVSASSASHWAGP